MLKKILSILTLSLLTVNTVFAESVTVDKFRGLARNPVADKIEDGSHVKFDNVYINDNNIQVIKGRERLNTTANSDTVVNGFFYYRNQAGTTEKLIVAESDELVTYDLDGTNRTSIASSLTNSSWDAVQIGDTVYFTNETNGLYKWTGTGSATAITGVSTPSSVNFSATTSAGGLTPGQPVVVAANLQADETCDIQNDAAGACQETNGGCIRLLSNDSGGENVTSDDGTLEVAGTTSTYSYRVAFFNNSIGIESEPSTVDSAVLNGNNKFTWNGTDCKTCAEDDSNTCNDLCCTGIDYTTSGSETSTSGSLSAASSPFNTVRVYRTPVGGGESFFLVGEKTSGTFTDGTPDEALGPALDTTIDTITPPSYKFIEEYKGAVIVAENNSLRFSRVPVALETDADKYWLETDEITFGTNITKITGLKKTSNSLLIFTTNTIQELSGFGTTSFRIQNLVQNVGTISDDTIQTDSNGDLIFFAGTAGVYKIRVGDQATGQLSGELVGRQGTALTKISSPDLDSIFRGTDSQISLSLSDYTSSVAYYDLAQDLYFLYIGQHGFMFDAKNATWSHVPGIKVKKAVFVNKSTTEQQAYLIDDLGFFYKNWKNYTNGVTSGTVTGNPTSSAATTLTDSLATFFTTNDGLKGQWVVVNTSGSFQYRRITSNTATELTVESAWTVNPVTTDIYYVGHIIPDILTKQYNIVKPPQETRVQYFTLVHNKAASTQTLYLKSFREKQTSHEDLFTINLATDFVDKKGTDLRSSWVQWSLQTFVYNTSDTITLPLDIINYTIDVQEREKRVSG